MIDSTTDTPATGTSVESIRDDFFERTCQESVVAIHIGANKYTVRKSCATETRPASIQCPECYEDTQGEWQLQINDQGYLRDTHLLSSIYYNDVACYRIQALFRGLNIPQSYSAGKKLLEEHDATPMTEDLVALKETLKTQTIIQKDQIRKRLWEEASCDAERAQVDPHGLLLQVFGPTKTTRRAQAERERTTYVANAGTWVGHVERHARCLGLHCERLSRPIYEDGAQVEVEALAIVACNRNHCSRMRRKLKDLYTREWDTAHGIQQDRRRKLHLDLLQDNNITSATTEWDVTGTWAISCPEWTSAVKRPITLQIFRQKSSRKTRSNKGPKPEDGDYLYGRIRFGGSERAPDPQILFRFEDTSSLTQPHPDTTVSEQMDQILKRKRDGSDNEGDGRVNDGDTRVKKRKIQQALVDRATSDPELKDLLRTVAEGYPSVDQLRSFRDQMTEIETHLAKDKRNLRVTFSADKTEKTDSRNSCIYRWSKGVPECHGIETPASQDSILEIDNNMRGVETHQDIDEKQQEDGEDYNEEDDDDWEEDDDSEEDDDAEEYDDDEEDEYYDDDLSSSGLDTSDDDDDGSFPVDDSDGSPFGCSRLDRPPLSLLSQPESASDLAFLMDLWYQPPPLNYLETTHCLCKSPRWDTEGDFLQDEGHDVKHFSAYVKKHYPQLVDFLKVKLEEVAFTRRRPKYLLANHQRPSPHESKWSFRWSDRLHEEWSDMYFGRDNFLHFGGPGGTQFHGTFQRDDQSIPYMMEGVKISNAETWSNGDSADPILGRDQGIHKQWSELYTYSDDNCYEDMESSGDETFYSSEDYSDDGYGRYPGDDESDSESSDEDEEITVTDDPEINEAEDFDTGMIGEIPTQDIADPPIDPLDEEPGDPEEAALEAEILQWEAVVHDCQTLLAELTRTRSRTATPTPTPVVIPRPGPDYDNDADDEDAQGYEYDSPPCYYGYYRVRRPL